MQAETRWCDLWIIFFSWWSVERWRFRERVEKKQHNARFTTKFARDLYQPALRVWWLGGGSTHCTFRLFFSQITNADLACSMVWTCRENLSSGQRGTAELWSSPDHLNSETHREERTKLMVVNTLHGRVGKCHRRALLCDWRRFCFAWTPCLMGIRGAGKEPPRTPAAKMVLTQKGAMDAVEWWRTEVDSNQRCGERSSQASSTSTGTS